MKRALPPLFAATASLRMADMRMMMDTDFTQKLGS
jgi:hypothetical protein